MNTESYKIILTDDEIWIRENLKQQINSSELSVECIDLAADGEEALRKMACDCPDILITDINMPFMSGIELIRNVKRNYPHVIIIVLSGYSDFEYVREALLEGAIDYILKPISQTDLENVLLKAIKIIDDKRQMSVEMQENREKLQIASSIIFDKEMSEFIEGDKRKTTHNTNIKKLSEIELNFARFNLILVKTDSIHNILKRKALSNINSVAFHIKNLLSACIDSPYSIVFNNSYVPNEFIVLVVDKDSDQIDAICRKSMEELKRYTDYYVSIAVSCSHFSFDDIRNAYNEALGAMMTRKYKPGNYVIDAARIEDVPIARYLSAEQENQIIFAVQNNNKKLLRTIIEEQLAPEIIEKKNMLFLEVKQTVDKIAWIIMNYSTNINTTSEIREIETLIELLNLSIEKFELNEVHGILDQIMDGALKDNDSYNSNENIRRTVAAIEKYICENYFEDLSLTSLAKQFLVDRSYLSRFFKYETGENLMLYIAKKRIEKAVGMMAEDNATLSEISSLVGYDDYAYFNRVFRKITGKSPREYKTMLEEQA